MALSNKKLSGKLCDCIKQVRKTVKARKGSTKERAAIGICVKSVLQTRGRTLKRFSCDAKQSLRTQKIKREVPKARSV
jgi:hypothetical protein